MTSFVEKLDAQSLKVFNDVCARPFSDQAMFLLNAFWTELESEANCIYECLWEIIKKVDMDNKGISLIHKYTEGNDLDFDMALRLYEASRVFFDKNPKWKTSNPKSSPADLDLTAIVRKKRIRENVDVNFDGRISFLEFLLDLYQLSPKDLLDRSKGASEPPEVTAAKKALSDVQKKINEYEEYKLRLENESILPGVKGLTAKNLLFQLDASPLSQELRKLLITAEAAVRIAIRKYGSGSGEPGAGSPTAGSIWWLQTDLDVKKKKYSPQNK